MLDGNTSPCSRHFDPASNRSSSWRTLCIRKASTAKPRKADSTTASRGLWLDQLEFTLNELKRRADLQRAVFQGNGIPLQAKSLALAQADRQCDSVEGF